MSVTTVTQRLVDILSDQSEIRRVERLSASTYGVFPTFLVAVSDGQYERSDFNMIRSTRDYTIFGLVGSLTAGRETEMEQRVTPFYDLIESLFLARPGLGRNGSNTDLIEGVTDCYLVGDSGYTVIELGGTKYAGSTWTIRVVELIHVDTQH